jgi:hypothetical protein
MFWADSAYVWLQQEVNYCKKMGENICKNPIELFKTGLPQGLISL